MAEETDEGRTELLRNVCIVLGVDPISVDPSGDVLAVARQAASAAREVDTALLVLAVVDEPAEPLVAAVRRLLRERDEARATLAEIGTAMRVDIPGILVESAFVRQTHSEAFVRLRGLLGVGGELAPSEAERDETEADAALLRTAIYAALCALRDGIDALGSSNDDVIARNSARDAVGMLEGEAERGAAPAEGEPCL